MKIIAKEAKINYGQLQRNFKRIKHDYALRPKDSTRVDVSSGDVSITESGEVIGNIFENLSPGSAR